MADTIVLALMLVLLLAGFWQVESRFWYRYRSGGRWTGPWDNPNIFGVMMGVGLVLAVGKVLVQSPKPKVESQGEGRVSGVEGGSLSKVQGWGGRVWKWLRFAFCGGGGGDGCGAGEEL